MAFATCQHEIDSNNKKQINPCKSFRNYDQIRCQNSKCNVTTRNTLDPLTICLKCCKFYCTKNKHNEIHSQSKQHKMSMIIPSSNDFIVFNESEIKSDIMAIWCHSCQIFMDKTHKNQTRIQLLQQSIYTSLYSLLSTNKQSKKRKKKKKQKNVIIYQNENNHAKIHASSSSFKFKYKKNNIEFVADNNNIEYDKYYENEKEDKKCIQCNEWKNENEGYIDNTNSNDWYCINCWTEFNHTIIENNKQLKTYNCIKCTYINDITSEKCIMCETKYIAPEIGKCFVCNVSRDITPLFQCKRCLGWKRYCSIICQQMDWNKSHKIECIEIENKKIENNIIDYDYKFDNNAIFEWNNIDYELNDKINNLEIKLKEEKKCLKSIYNKLNKLKLKQIENNLFIESCELNWKQWKSNDFISWIIFIDNGYFNNKYEFKNVNVNKIDTWSNLNYIQKDKNRKYFVGIDLKYITIKRLRNDLFEFISNKDSNKLCKYIRKLINGELNKKEEDYKYDNEQVNDDDIKLCVICMDNNKSHALSCGHIYCETCAKQLKKCSFCNKDITTIIKLFNLY